MKRLQTSIKVALCLGVALLAPIAAEQVQRSSALAKEPALRTTPTETEIATNIELAEITPERIARQNVQPAKILSQSSASAPPETILQTILQNPILIVISIGGTIIVVGSAILFILQGVVKINENEVGIVNKRRSGLKLPPGRLIALHGEAGYQADTLLPGLYGFLPWTESIRKEKAIAVPPGEIALVVAKDGAPLPPGRTLGKVVACNDFQDARAFLKNGGEKGRQLGILSAGTYRINTALFTVITTANAAQHGMNREDLRIYIVDSDKIGIVTTYEGVPIPEREIAGSAVQGHNKFQNAQQFLDRGGCQGLQEEVLQAGFWHLNPWFVRVEPAPLVEIPIGAVGVVISSVGKSVEENNSETLVAPGYKGVWKTPLYRGKYPINTKVMEVVIVPTHEIVLDWSNNTKHSSNYDANLQALRLRSRDGFGFDIEVTQIIKINIEDAPKMIARVGCQPEVSISALAVSDRYPAIKSFVNRVLQPMTSMYFRSSASYYNVLDFVDKFTDIQQDAVDYFELNFRAYGVSSISISIKNIEIPDVLEETVKARTIAREERKTYQEQQLAEIEHQRLARLQAITTVEAEKLTSIVIREIDESIKQIEVKTVKGSGMFLHRPGKLVLQITNHYRETLEPVAIEISESSEYSLRSDRRIILSSLESQESKEISFTLLMKRAKEVAVNYKINNVLPEAPIYINVVQDNPYIYGSPVAGESSFFGREKELEQIIQAVIKPTKQDILIIGERRTGKTSLLNQLKHRLKGTFIAVYILLNTSELTTEGILNLIVKEIADRLIQQGILIERHLYSLVEDSSGFMDNLKTLVGLLKDDSSDSKIVLLIDEADYLLKVKQTSSDRMDDRVQNILRAALQSSEIGPYLRAVVAATSDLSAYVSQRSSPFFNHFRFVKLRLFSDEEIRTLIVETAKRFGYEYTEPAIQQIMQLSGGQPYYCQALCYESFSHAIADHREQITAADVQVAEQKIVEDFFPSYRSSFWERFNSTEKDFVGALACDRIPKSSKRSETERLLDWQIIAAAPTEQSEQSGQYYFPSGLVKQWTLMAIE